MAYNAERLFLADDLQHRMEFVIEELVEARDAIPPEFEQERAAIGHALYAARATLMDIRVAVAKAAGVIPPIGVNSERDDPRNW
jgi:uncharacterized protein (DUF1786 family)